jgi:hypothetical protein
VAAWDRCERGMDEGLACIVERRAEELENDLAGRARSGSGRGEAGRRTARPVASSAVIIHDLCTVLLENPAAECRCKPIALACSHGGSSLGGVWRPHEALDTP